MDICGGIWYNQIMKHLLEGKRFGKLVVLKECGRSNDRSVIWECLCDCGNTAKITSKSLISQDTKSCGCLRRIAKGEANFNKLYSNYKDTATRKGLKFSLTKEEFKSLTQENCHYCGSYPSQLKNRKYSNGAYLFNGIDRKDNAKGYILGNVLPCCFTCNRAKSDMSYEEFILWIKAIKTR